MEAIAFLAQNTTVKNKSDTEDWQQLQEHYSVCSFLWLDSTVTFLGCVRTEHGHILIAACVRELIVGGL